MSEIHEDYKPLYTSDKRYFLITGGRASLKSTTVHDWVSRLTYERGQGILFTRYTMKSAEISIIPEFSETLQKLDIRNDFYITKNFIKNRRSGSFIIFSGIKTSSGDQTANLKSLPGITTWVNEEGEDFKDENAFDRIDDSIRSGEKHNRVVWIMNSSDSEHFIYKRFIEKTHKRIEIEGQCIAVSTHPDVEAIHTTYHIAKRHLSDGWLQKVTKSRENNPRMYTHLYLGGWLEQREGVIFENWTAGEFDHSLPWCYGQDYGYHPDPYALGKVAVDKKGKKIYLKELAYAQNLSVDQIKAIYQKNNVGKHVVITDINEPRTTTELNNSGHNVLGASKKMIIDNIREMHDYLIVVDPDSPNAVKELNNYIWHDKKANLPIDDYNHLMDLMRYCFNYLTGQTLTTYWK